MKTGKSLVRECCYGPRKARMMNGSWRQLFSIPAVVSHVSFPLLAHWNCHYCLSRDNIRDSLIIFISSYLWERILTFHNFMIFHCTLCARCILCCLLRLGCFWRKMGTIRRNWWTIFHIYHMLVTIQRTAWGLSNKERLKWHRKKINESLIPIIQVIYVNSSFHLALTRTKKQWCMRS